MKNKDDRLSEDEIYFKFKFNNLNIEVWYQPHKVNFIAKKDLKHIIKSCFIDEIIEYPIIYDHQYYLFTEDDNFGILFYYLRKRKKIYIDSIEIVYKEFIINYKKDINMEKEKRAMMLN